MKVSPGYKQTDVGVIPEDWDIEPLGTRASFKTGPFGSTLHQSDYVDGGIPVINPMHINDGRITPNATMSVSEEAARRLADFCMKPGEIIIGRRGDMGRCAVVDKGHAGWMCGTGSMLIRPRLDHPDFLQRILSSTVVIKAIEDASVGSTMINLNQATLSRLNIQIPPIEEQDAIATALSDMDALLDGLDRLIAKKRAIKQATMQQLLTGQTRLPGFSGEWVTQKLGNDAILKARIGWQGLTTAEYLDDGDFFLVTGTDFLNGRIDWRNCHFVTQHRYSQDPFIQVRPRDVLVTKDGTIGKVALIDTLEKPATLNSGVFVIRPKPDKFIPEFFYFLLMSKVFEEFLAQLSAGSTINHLYQKDFVGFTYQIPPTAEEQTAIATVLSDMDAEITALETRHIKTRSLKQAMMQELLTGRTRLVKSAEKPDEEASAQTQGRKANVHFLRSVLAAEIIDQLHDQPTFGHVKFEKMMFLAEHLCEVDTGSTYHRKAAGPYDNRALRSIDSQLQKQQWFEARKQDGRYQYVPLAKRGGHKPYFERHFSGIVETLENILSTFKTAKTEKCEIVATLLAAWSDLLREKGTVSDEMIVHEVLHNWHEAKQRIPEDRWLKALAWMREKDFVPQGVTLP